MEDMDQCQLLSNRIKEHGSKHKIQELCLDQLPLVSLTHKSASLLQKCLRLEHLSLCSCSLTTINLIPNFPQLQILELSDNQYTISYQRLQSEHLEPIGKFLRLYELNLDNNIIQDFMWTKFLKRNRIASLSLKGNPITLEPDYKQRTFRALGVDLDTLDGVDRQGNAADDSLSSEDDDESSQYSEDIKEESGEEGDNNASIEDNSIEEKISKNNVEQERRETIKEKDQPAKEQ